MVNTRVGAGSAFATLPFDQLDGVAGFFVHDDFEAAALVTDLVSSAGVVYDTGHTAWLGGEVSGAAVSNITIPVSVADHVGILRLEVGSTSAATGDAAFLAYGRGAAAVQDVWLPDDNGIYIATVIRIADVSDTIVGFGLHGQAASDPNSSDLDSIAIAFDPADTTNTDDKLFFAQVNDAGSDQETIMTNVEYTENDWVLLEISATDTSAEFRVTTEDATETVSITHTVTVALRPIYVVENVGAAEEVLDIDLFHLRYLRRDALVGTGSDWLGA